MAGFGLSGLCISRLLFMVLNPLCWLLIAYASFVPPSIGLFGLVVNLWLVLVLSSACWRGPRDVILPCCEVWFRFRLLRRYLALWPAEIGRVYRLLEMVGEGSPGHGPIHLLAASAAEVGSCEDWLVTAWGASAE